VGEVEDDAVVGTWRLIAASACVGDTQDSIPLPHNMLTLAGARSRLHVWDGLGHCFYLDPDLPESREVERIVVDFFAENLGPS
jgi:hypothetical protein